MRIGIDVGGTNTDAVLMQGDSVVSSTKQPTTQDVSSGIVSAIEAVLGSANIASSQIDAVMIGTTHFTNAFVERKHLQRVGVLRIALPATAGLPPMTDWPEELIQTLGADTVMVRGGYQCDGRVNSVLDEDAVGEAALRFRELGIRSVAVSSLFSPVNSSMEERAEEILSKYMPGVSVTLSHKIGKLGLLERENAAIINASLADLARKVTGSFKNALDVLKISAPFFISQNDGTLLTADQVSRYSVLTFASGPTNSLRGAAFLSGIKDAMVADIGGTTTDIGMLVNGFPRESSMPSSIGGVRTNFRMPDILSVGLGGGSIVRQNGQLTVGPDSVGYRIVEKARIFGGDVLTATDIAVAAGHADIGEKSAVADLPGKLIDAVVDNMHVLIQEGVDYMKSNAAPIPLILVGGGAVLVSRKIAGMTETIVPAYSAVANAVGASIAQVSGEVDQIFFYDEIERETALENAKAKAINQAVNRGAEKAGTSIIDLEETPLAYIPGGAVRVRVKAAGSMAGYT